MKLTTARAIFVCFAVHAYVVEHGDAQATATSGIDNIITTFIDRLPGIFGLIQRFAKLSPVDGNVDVTNPKYNDNKFKIGEESIVKGSSGSDGIGNVLKLIINVFGAKFPVLKGFIDPSVQPDAKTKGLIRDGLALANKGKNLTFFDLFAALSKVRHLDRFGVAYYKALAHSPLLKTLNDEAMAKSVQFRVLLAILLGQRPAVRDMLQISDGSIDWQKVKAIFTENNQLHQLVEMTLNKKPDANAVLKLITGKPILLNGKLSPTQTNHKYAVAATDDSHHNDDLRVSSYVVFALSNFGKLMDIVQEISKPSPRFFQLVLNSLAMNLAPLKWAKKPETKLIMESDGPLLSI